MSILYEATGGGGHDMKPEPSGGSLPESDIIEYVQGVYDDDDETNQEVASIWSIANWSNLKRIRVLCPAANMVGAHTGIGTWKDGVIDPSTDEADWWQNDYFKLLATNATVDGYDVDYSIKVGDDAEVVTLGGYIIDTDTGKLCIKFANYVINPTAVKVAVDITFTRTDVG